MTSENSVTDGMTICLTFITERCVATNVGTRDEPEWPPHPGRVFMAMAAAYFEAEGTEEEKAAERDALNWLAEVSEDTPPQIHATREFRRTNVTCYVPVNDSPKPNKAMLQSAPGMPRSRQPRNIPTVIPDAENGTRPHVQLVWEGVVVPDEHLAALDRVCRNMIRVGHSSSFVMAWVQSVAEPVRKEDKHWKPSEANSETAYRIATTGELDRLEQACGATRIDQFADLAMKISDARGKEKAALKTEFEAEFGEPFKNSLRPPEPRPPVIGVWQGYSCSDDSEPGDLLENSYFEREMLILEKIEGPVLNVERTLSLARALRDTAMASCPNQPPPEWLSGHSPDGKPTTKPHAAFLALPFAGTKYADGHLMGLAIALPKGIDAVERGRALGPLLIDSVSGEPRQIKLWGKKLPDVVVRLLNHLSPPRTLDNLTWTKPSQIWASVTPVVLDTFPKSSKRDERQMWFDEVRAIVELSCTRAGLPAPVQIDIDITSWHTGAPRAESKTRRRRGSASDARSPLGNGFPSMPNRPSRPTKPQVHVWIRFAEPVAGPVIVGAGRFGGYGLCLPVSTPKR